MPYTSKAYRVKGPVRGGSRPSVYSDLYAPRRARALPLLGLLGAVVAVVLVVVFAVGALASAPSEEPESVDESAESSAEVSGDDALAPLVIGEGAVTGSGLGRVSVCAVGDNVLNEELLVAADAASGEVGDGAYDFEPLYAAVTPTIKNDYDIAFINQETVLGGESGFIYAGYPSYNSPDDVAQAIVDGGWDVVNCNSNHTFDIGPDAIHHEIALWQDYPDVLTIGMFEDTSEARRVRMIERNGIKVAFLSYSYGLNGYSATEEGTFAHDVTGDSYDLDGSLVNLISEEKLSRDIPAAKAVADAVIVSMHFGQEYSHEPDEYQRTWAQRCADLGADVVIGTHTHFIQPVEWLEGSDGNQTLVAWCLGDFASAYGRMDASIGGMFSFDFIRGDDGAIAVENLLWTPTIEHLEDGAYTIYFLKDYTEELAERNEQYTFGSSLYNTQEMVADIRAYAKTMSEEVIGDSVAIDA